MSRDGERKYDKLAFYYYGRVLSSIDQKDHSFLKQDKLDLSEMYNLVTTRYTIMIANLTRHQKTVI